MTFDINYYKGMTAKLNEVLHLDIQLRPATAFVVLPEAELSGQVIRFNPKLETMMLLFDLSLQSKTLSSRAVNRFLLYHLHLGKGHYSDAGKMLQLLSQDVSALKQPVGKASSGTTIDTLLLQTSFALCHEVSHIYFRCNPAKRTEEVEGVRGIIDDITRHFGQGLNMLPRWMRAIWPKSTLLDIDDAFDYSSDKINDNLCEEIACDILAYNLVMNVMLASGFSREEMTIEGANISMVIDFVETYKQLEDAYLNSRKDIQHHNVRINTLRHTCLFYVVWEWIEQKMDRATKYVKHLNAYGCDSRYGIFAGFFQHLSLVDSLRMDKQPPDAKAVQQLEREFKAIDDAIRSTIS